MEYSPTASEKDQLENARQQAWIVLRKTADLIQPGMNESEARKVVQAELTAAGAEKSWHAPKIRFGSETLKSFSAPADQNIRLKESDIFFLDYGPVFGDFEADVGDTFVRGDNLEHLHLQKQCREIFHIVADHWRKNRVTGVELYQFAESCAKERDVKLESEKAGGHIVAEFPHRLKHRGGMTKFQETVVNGVWVLEIQLSSLRTAEGSFYEDLLIEV